MSVLLLLLAITNRGTKKDFVDLYELLGLFSLKELIQFYLEKHENGFPFITMKSLVWFEDAEADPMRPALLVNRHLNRKHKIYKKQLEYRLVMLETFLL